VRDRRRQDSSRADARAARTVQPNTRGVESVSQELVLGIYVFIMAIFVGFEVIARVPSVLHTPLMSGTNAIHGIVVLGAMLVAGSADTTLVHALGFIAVVFGAANVFGGFVVTDRMLEMFKKRQAPVSHEEQDKKKTDG
jgi:H+-translocating NAD(P) transhydrogenase subunit alpha